MCLFQNRTTGMRYPDVPGGRDRLAGYQRTSLPAGRHGDICRLIAGINIQRSAFRNGKILNFVRRILASLFSGVKCGM